MTGRPTMLVVTGPPCAGKSTAALEWAAGQTETTALVDLDFLRRSIVAGYANPAVELPPSAEAERQWRIATELSLEMARRYVSEGYQCVVDAPGVYPSFPRAAWRWDTWRPGIEDLRGTLVVLVPAWELIAERNRNREPPRSIGEPVLRSLYDAICAWESQPGVAVIDNTTMTVAETVSAIEAVVGSETT